MLHSNNPINNHKFGLLNLPEELGNVSKAHRVMGVSRNTFYRYQEAIENGGIDSLLNAKRRKLYISTVYQIGRLTSGGHRILISSLESS